MTTLLMNSLRRRQNDDLVTCDGLLQNCKHQAKQLLEVTVNSKKIHWSHPAFVSFCLSVEDILSHGVRRRFISLLSSHNSLTSSGRVLQELSRVFPVARSIYQMCYGPKQKNKVTPDYARIQSNASYEKKILWIRTAIVEKTMSAIIHQLLEKPELYYTKRSVMYHQVYSELFAYLLEGPCSLLISRMKTLDSSVLSPGPTELVSRHSRVIPPTSDVNIDTPSFVMWEHVQSLYQSSVNACLFGKNNILMHPPGSSQPLRGYLTLVEISQTLFIKWLPNTLINGTNLMWMHVLSVDVTHEVAHLHCHQKKGQEEAELIMVGFNGIAYPSLKFPKPSSLVMFLEALENGLHPYGSLEPPLWFLRQQHANMIPAPSDIIRSVVSPSHPLNSFTLSNQVFRVRFSKSSSSNNETEELEWMESDADTPTHSRLSPPYPQNISPLAVTESKQSSRKFSLERFENKVSSQLLARYFYSWLSYCRHIARVKKSLSHLIYPLPSSPLSPLSPLPPLSPPVTYGKLDDQLWNKFTSQPNDTTWQTILTSVYNGGIEHHLRQQVWPYLLGVYQPLSTSEQREDILKKEKKMYHVICRKWKALERQHYINTDPTSTSVDIRLGGAAGLTPPTNRVRSLSPLIEEESCDNHVISSEDDDDSGCEDLVLTSAAPRTSDSSMEDTRPSGGPHSREISVEQMDQSEGEEISRREQMFLDELYKIDKDIPRCDRDYDFFRVPQNLTKLRNIIASYIWENTSTGYSQGMCDLMAPLLVIFQNEEITFACFKSLMVTMDQCFPPKTGVSQRMANLQSLLQILENDFYQYLCDQPMGEALFYTYRWFLVNFKREFSYDDIFLLWETSWAAKLISTEHFEVFVALSLLQEYKAPIMDAQLDPSEILNLLTDLAEKKVINCQKLISSAQRTINNLQTAV